MSTVCSNTINSQSSTHSTTNPGYFRYPDVHKHWVTFIAEEEVWLWDQRSQHCQRLTVDGNAQNSPAMISPDGQWVAMVLAPDSNADVYCCSIQGGRLQRLTYQGEVKRLFGWHSPNKIGYIASTHSVFQQGQGYYIDIHTHEKTKLELSFCEHIATADQQQTLVVQRLGYGYATWKRYQGGTAGQLWIKRSHQKNFERLILTHTNCEQPRCHDNRVYFLSDHQDHGNVYSCDFQGQNLRRHTHHQDFYVRAFAIHQTTLIYSCGGSLYQLDLSKPNHPPSVLTIPYHSPKPQLEGLFCKQHPLSTMSFDLSEDAQTLSVIKRGKLMLLPTWFGGIKAYFGSADKRYKACYYLKSSKQWLAVADLGFEDSLELIDPTKPSNTATLNIYDWGKILDCQPCPKGKTIAIANQKHELLILDIEEDRLDQVDHSSFSTLTDCNWSGDGHWLTYSKAIDHHRSVILVFELNSKAKTIVSNPLYSAFSPCFDTQGRYLFYLANTEFSAHMDPMHFQYNFNANTSIFCALVNSTVINPLIHPDHIQPETDEKTKAQSKKTARQSETPWQIDPDHIKQKYFLIPAKPKAYTQIQVHENSLLLHERKSNHQSDDDDGCNLTIHHYQLDKLCQDPLYESIFGMSLITHTPKWTLIAEDTHKLRVVTTGEKIDDEDESFKQGGLIDLNRIKLHCQPQEEWPFILKEAWRLQKDFFWDHDMGGLDWQAVYNKYQKLLPKISSRRELNDLIAEMQGELGASHAYIWGGQNKPYRYQPHGQLGFESTLDKKSGRFKITHVLPQLDPSSTETQSPCQGFQLDKGDTIVSIDGQAPRSNLPPEALVIDKVGQWVEFSILKPRTKKPIHGRIKPRASTHTLCYRNWVEANRQWVAEQSQDQLGYIHIPDMGAEGYAEFMRSYLPSFDKPGLIIDIRYNRGGHVSSLILQKIALKRFGLDLTRWHDCSFAYPIETPKGSTVALCNAYTASDGDMFAHAFKTLKLGKLLGERTWGGVIGIHPRFKFLDGGQATQPEFAVWFENVGYQIENHGVEPDVTIIQSPSLTTNPVDLQLKEAVKLSLENLAQQTDLDSKAKHSTKSKLTPRPLPESPI